MDATHIRHTDNTQGGFYPFGGVPPKIRVGQNLWMARKKRPTHQRTFVKQWRKHRGLNQDQLAERVGIGQNTISRLENGKIGYTQPIMEAIADALNCTVADLVIRDPTDPSAPWSIWESIPPVDRSQALKVLQAFTKKTGT
jgi:DNA-binding XRE family transcriptional regulator